MCGRITGAAPGSLESLHPRKRISLRHSVTHGTPRQHIWTFVAGSTLEPIGSVPSYVGQDYFCDSSQSGGINNWNGMECVTYPPIVF